MTGATPLNSFDLTLETDTANSAAIEPHADLQFAWSDLSYMAPKREQPILNNLNGSARSGELLAGKSLYSPSPSFPLTLLYDLSISDGTFWSW